MTKNKNITKFIDYKNNKNIPNFMFKREWSI